MKRALFLAIALIAALQFVPASQHVADFPPPPLSIANS